ncbi:MAG: hypothetical protein ACPG8W_16260 [Candidatus Promineifilaceae bacterium]
MDYNPQFIRQAQFIIWAQWVFFNLFGWAFGLFATWGTQTDTITRFGWIAMFLGIGQWLILRNYLRRPTWLWIGLTAVGMMAAQYLAQQFVDYLIAQQIVSFQGVSMLSGFLIGGVIGVLIGACLSLAHLILLPRTGTLIRDWFMANTVGWGLGFQVGTILGALLFSADYRFTSLIAVLLSAIISGLWVTQLIHLPQSER